MSDLIIGKTNVTTLLKEKYKKLGKGWMTLLQVPSEHHMNVNSESLKILIGEMGYHCVYITLSKTFREMDALFKSRGVDVQGLSFIDAISNMYGVKQEQTKRCKYTHGPLGIDEISSSLRELLQSITAEKKCVFLDSITTIMLYNSMPRTLRFSTFLTETLKKLGVDGVMVCIARGEATKKLLTELSKQCNEVISIEKGGGVKTLKE